MNSNILKISLFILFLLSLIVMFYIFNYNATNKIPLKFPFFLSTKYDKSYVRTGPAKEYPIIFIYNQKAIPFMVIAAYKNWYKIKDFSGQEGWLNKTLAMSNKKAIILNDTYIYRFPNFGSKILVTLKHGLLVSIEKCALNTDYCKIYLKLSNKRSIIGWVLKEYLWGISK